MPVVSVSEPPVSCGTCRYIIVVDSSSSAGLSFQLFTVRRPISWLAYIARRPCTIV